MQHSRTVEEEIQGIDKILKQLEAKSGSGYEAWRRTQAVQKQKDNKVDVLVPPPPPLLLATVYFCFSVFVIRSNSTLWTCTPLIRTRHCHGQFAFSLGKESPYIFAKFNLLKTDTFYGSLSVCINRV